MRADPNCAALVAGDGHDGIVGKPVSRRKDMEFSLLETNDPAAVRTDPKRPFRVFIQRANRVIRQSIGRCIGSEFTVSIAGKTPRIGRNPQVSSAIDQKRDDRVVV